MFVGLQGSGKTTTCTKVGLHYQRKGFKVGLVCTDTFRAGAFDQLKQNATKAKIPYFGSYSESDPVQLAKEGVTKFKNEHFDIIIVDTSGRHRQEQELFEEMRQISDAVKPDNIVFVLDGTIGQAAEAHARAFKETVDVGSIVITKMDGHAKGGGAISAVATIGAPIEFIGVGEHVHDLEPFKANSFVSKMLGMGDISGLLEKVSDLNIDQKDMMKKIEAGVYSLRDMREQFKMISGMGPMSKIMGMIPGMNADMLGPLADQQGADKMKHYLCAMDSMTDQELDSDGKVFIKEPTRINRLARGAGVHVREIHELLIQYTHMEKMIKTMGGQNGLLKTLQEGKQQRGGLHPNQKAKMQKQMQNLLPPGMMQQLGGMGGLQQMMQQMGAGGMPDLSALQNMMGGMPDMSGLANMLGGAPPGPSKAPKKTKKK
ncbi:SRP54-type protein [Gorgonomyces haynaldii]|nr:SRP54-type protein [Gorgonomyces haynaldii]